MNIRSIFFGILSLCTLYVYAKKTQEEETSFVIITASYNNHEWCQPNLQSIFQQDYSNWRLVYINDCSTDDTAERVQSLINEYGCNDKVTFINNPQRMGHLYNHYYAIHACSDDEVIVIVDGDDWLKGPDVLSYLNTIYRQHTIWITYGQFWYWKKNHLGCSRQIPAEVLETNTIRDYPIWITSHLRTFYAGLYKRIHLSDLLFDGKFFPMSADVATMIPMIEMAGPLHSQFISRILYIYNDANSLNFYHHHAQQQNSIHAYIRSLARYQPLENLPFLTTRRCRWH